MRVIPNWSAGQSDTPSRLRDCRRSNFATAHTLAFIVGRFGGFASGYVVENANSIPFATTVLIIMAALSALGTMTLRETMGERLS